MARQAPCQIFFTTNLKKLLKRLEIYAIFVINIITKNEVDMKNYTLIENWKLCYVDNQSYKAKNVSFTMPKHVEESGFPIINASVPGNFELDFMREGILDDVYFGINSIKAHRLENLHFYYYADFELKHKDGFNSVLSFEGIDTVAEIFVDGEKLAFVENMHHAHKFDVNALKEGKHSIVVHILPVVLYARQFDIPSMCFGMKYNHDAIEVRKSASMFGWDIMPRIVSAGLFKPVKVEYVKKTRIKDPFVYLERLNNEKTGGVIICTFKVETEDDFIFDYKVKIKGKCKDHEFYHEMVPYSASNRLGIDVKDAYLWWPKNYGEPNLYDVEFALYKGEELCDTANLKIGLRKIWLKRTSVSGDKGDFCFIVNGKRIFVTGTNWVPTDAFPSRHGDYDLRGLEFANDLGCNMVRCWGGNTYPSHEFYNYCDEHGIMVWQDFAMGCGHYPDDERLCVLMKEEVKQVAIAYRNHPSLALWAGDNECDVFVVYNAESDMTEDDQPANLNPNLNKLTRDVVLKELRNHDASRPYLPSSPYVDEVAYRTGIPSELHIWGPRDFFKGQYYGTTKCHFASEIGYHGCPSPNSIEKFISKESMPQDSITEIYENPEWLIHAAGIEPYVEGNPYAYRLPLMVSQVERIFGEASGDLYEFARQSQISQAEAKKYFIESFRAKKWRRTGILWWNVIDGWPQVSDAIIDWYGTKKLAYGYIKRSQAPLCLLFDEPKDGKITLIAANDSRACESVEYKVTNLVNDEVALSGKVDVEKDGKIEVDSLVEEKNAFYLIEWKYSLGEGKNHFVTTIGDNWTYDKYKACMIKAGFYDEFEGFDK